MGLFDSVVGNVLNNLGGEQGGGNDMLQLVMALIQQNGGLGGLLDKLGQGGLTEQVSSWVGNGDNLPLSAEQVSQALGSGPLADLAARFGLDTRDASAALARFLPDTVNRLTPEGRLPDNAHDTDLLGQGLAALTGKLFG